MKKVIYDTNFYNDLSNEYPEVVDTFVKNVKLNLIVLMPSIIEHELLSFSMYEEDTDTREQINDYIALSKNNIISLDSEIGRKAAEVRRYYRRKHNKRLKAPDAIIAATAITRDATLFSNNDKDFHIATEIGLNYINPITDQEDLQKFRNKYKLS